MKTEIISCDICGSTGKVVNENIQVVFTTEQTEGRYSEPYLSNEKIDICMDCLGRRLKGESIYANGAQGYNNYYFAYERKSNGR